ncbi:hypothetical protein HMPREF3212_03597 [Citrobacter freundii]|nr:hypothetical protein HMPREF3212_03597 [Citrobacter freundii]
MPDGTALIRPTASSDAGVGRIRRLCRHPTKVSSTLQSCFQFPLSLLYEHFLASAL